jgi:hypothetical protein
MATGSRAADCPCVQPQASTPEGAPARTAAHGGLGPAAGSSPASAGPGLVRQSSVVVITMEPKHETKGAAARAAAAVMQQSLLTLLAIGLTLTIAPVAIAIEPAVTLVTKALPGFMSSLPCEGLFTERRGVHIVFIAALASFLAMNGFQITAVEANPRASRLLLHTMLVGLAACVVVPLWYASAMPSASALQVVAHGYLAIFLVYFAPWVSYAVSGLATANRRSYKLAALQLVFGVTASATATFLCATVAFYVGVSNRTGGFTGVAINGKDGWVANARPDSPAANRADPLGSR